MKQKHIGIISIFLSALMWALEPLFARFSYEESTFLETSIIRAYVIVCLTTGYLLIKNRKKLFLVTKPQLTTLIYIALIGTLGADLIYFYALVSTPILNAVLLGHLQPVFIILFAFILFHSEKIDRLTYLGIGMMMFSAILVSTKTIENALSLTFGTFGDALVLIATILWATTALAMRRNLRTLDAGTITFYRFFIASLFFTIILPFINIKSVNINQIFVGIVVGIGTIAYYEGLKRLKAAEVSGIELAAPFFAAGIGFFFLQESISSMQIIGLISLFAGVYLISSESKTHPHKLKNENRGS